MTLSYHARYPISITALVAIVEIFTYVQAEDVVWVAKMCIEPAAAFCYRLAACLFSQTSHQVHYAMTRRSSSVV